jgi:thioredoxin-like negative regulator of GroEL
VSDRLEALRAMLAEDPDDAFTRYAVAMELKGLGRRDEALAELKAVMADQPDYVPTYYQYGSLLEGEGRSDEAAQVVRAGIEVAEKAGDGHAKSELEDLLGEIEP